MNREVIHYNLQMIIAVGFKVNNDRAVRFRKWAMPQRLITTKMPRLPGSFSKWYRIRCIGPYIGIQQQS